MMNAAPGIVNTPAPEPSTRPKPRGRRRALRGSLCRRCPMCAPSGKCLAPGLKSGRCGDWVWYMQGGKQLRRLWVKPRDPRTPTQLYWRALLGTASARYSQALSDEQQNACITAGAKRRSRSRLGQSGPLTGQQFWVQSQCSRQGQAGTPNAQSAAKGLQTKRISLPTWDTHRSGTGMAPPQHRSGTRRSRPGFALQHGRESLRPAFFRASNGLEGSSRFSSQSPDSGSPKLTMRAPSAASAEALRCRVSWRKPNPGRPRRKIGWWFRQGGFRRRRGVRRPGVRREQPGALACVCRAELWGRRIGPTRRLSR